MSHKGFSRSQFMLAIIVAAGFLVTGVITYSWLTHTQSDASFGSYDERGSGTVQEPILPRGLVVRPDLLIADVTVQLTDSTKKDGAQLLSEAKAVAEAMGKKLQAIESDAAPVLYDVSEMPVSSKIRSDDERALRTTFRVQVPVAASGDALTRASRILKLHEALTEAASSLSDDKQGKRVKVSQFAGAIADVSTHRAKLMSEWSTQVAAIKTAGGAPCVPTGALEERKLNFDAIELSLVLACPGVVAR